MFLEVFSFFHWKHWRWLWHCCKPLSEIFKMAASSPKDLRDSTEPLFEIHTLTKERKETLYWALCSSSLPFVSPSPNFRPTWTEVLWSDGAFKCSSEAWCIQIVLNLHKSSLLCFGGAPERTIKAVTLTLNKHQRGNKWFSVKLQSELWFDLCKRPKRFLLSSFDFKCVLFPRVSVLIKQRVTVGFVTSASDLERVSRKIHPAPFYNSFFLFSLSSVITVWLKGRYRWDTSPELLSLYVEPKHPTWNDTSLEYVERKHKQGQRSGLKARFFTLYLSPLKQTAIFDSGASLVFQQQTFKSHPKYNV